MALFIPKDRRSLFRQFLGGMYDAVVITDPNGHILDINNRAVEHFGYELDDVLDKHISEIIPGLQQEVVPRIRKGLEGNQHVLIDANALTSSGEKIACEVAVSIIDLMNIGDLVFTIRNIERRRILMNSLRTRSNAFQLSPVALFACDAEGRFTEANAAFREMFDLPPEEELSAHTFSEFMNDDPLPDDFRRALAGEETLTGIVAEGDDGEENELEVALAPNRVGRKQLGVVGSVREL